MTADPSRDFVADFRAYADHPASGGMVPIHPDTLRAAAGEIERLRAKFHNLCMRIADVSEAAREES